MKKHFLSISFLFFLSYTLLPAQCPPGFLMDGPNRLVCSGDLYDTGCNTGDYSNDETENIILCSNSGNCLSITFDVFDTESSYDELTIRDGNSNTAPLIGTFSGTSLDGTTIQSSTGCLFLRWTSDGSITYPGWEASINCSACPTCVDGIQNGSETGVDCGGTSCTPCPCENEVIASLPYSQTGKTTCGFGDDYSSADACGNFYMNGDDYVFQYTPPTDQSISITLNNTLSYTGFFVLDNCPDAPGATCVASVTEFSGNPEICNVDLTGGTSYFIVVSTFPSPQCTPFDIDIQLNEGDVCGLAYAVSTISHNPVNYSNGTVVLMNDDEFGASLIDIPFEFCFDGAPYMQLAVSSNGYVSFPCALIPDGSATAGGDSPYEITIGIPNTTEAPHNSILGPFHDIDPDAGGTIRYRTHGSAPNRRFVIKYDDIPMYSFDCDSDNSLNFSGQIMLYETTNNIEIHLTQKRNCTAWNDANAILGLHSYDGSTAVIPAGGYNAPTNWTATNEAWLFSTSCSCVTPLAADISEFSGLDLGSEVQLDWLAHGISTADVFAIEKSRNFSTWEEIGTLGATMDQANYQFIDPEGLQNNKAFYRLRQTDLDGSFRYSKVIELISQTAPAFQIETLFPNPATENIGYRLSGIDPTQPIQITIKSLLGATVYQGTSTSRKGQVSVSNLSNGLYFMEFRSGNQLLRQKFLVKE